jgi:phosphatidylglycerophosphatase A
MSKALDQFAYALAIGLGTGLSPIAPGTVGSVLGLATSVLLVQLNWWLLPAFALLSSVLGIWICGTAARLIGSNDPGVVVWDEIAGVSIACCGWLFIHPHSPVWKTGWASNWSLDLNSTWTAIVLTFTLFRLLDILKPWPIMWLDENLHGGLGIMADDLLAGLISALLVVALMRVFVGV